MTDKYYSKKEVQKRVIAMFQPKTPQLQQPSSAKEILGAIRARGRIAKTI